MIWKLIFKILVVSLVILILYLLYKDIKTILKNRKKNSMLFINKPLAKDDNDQIGVSAYIEKLQQGIYSGAEVIAIASDFGTGKSSIISMLEKEYRIKRFRYKLSAINMWGIIKQDGDVTETHRNFIFQLVSSMNPKRGSLLSKRMSKNYGVFHVGMEHAWALLLTFLTLFLLIGAEAIRRGPTVVTEYLNRFFPWVYEDLLINISAIFYIACGYGKIMFAIDGAEDKSFS